MNGGGKRRALLHWTEFLTAIAILLFWLFIQRLNKLWITQKKENSDLLIKDLLLVIVSIYQLPISNLVKMQQWIFGKEWFANKFKVHADFYFRKKLVRKQCLYFWKVNFVVHRQLRSYIIKTYILYQNTNSRSVLY